MKHQRPMPTAEQRIKRRRNAINERQLWHGGTWPDFQHKGMAAAYRSGYTSGQKTLAARIQEAIAPIIEEATK